MLQVHLRPLESGDADTIASWCCNPNSVANTTALQGDYAKDPEYWRSVQASALGEHMLAICTFQNDECVGIAALLNIDDREKSAYGSVFVGVPQIRRKGVGAAALTTMETYAFETLGLNILRLIILASETELTTRLIAKGYIAARARMKSESSSSADADSPDEVVLEISRERWAITSKQ